IRRLRSLKDDLAIVVLTGECADEMRQLAFREGVQDFIGKDDSPSLLLARSVLYSLERQRVRLDQNRHFRELISSNPDAVVVVSLEGTVLFVNEAAVQLFDKPESELVGRPLSFPLQEDTISMVNIQCGKVHR